MNSTRYTIEISIVEIDDSGDYIREYDGVSFDYATTDIVAMETIMDEMYEAGRQTLEAKVDEKTLSERRSESEAPEWEDEQDE